MWNIPCAKVRVSHAPRSDRLQFGAPGPYDVKMEQKHRVVFYIDFHSKNSLGALCECSRASLYVPACTFMQLNNFYAVGEDLYEVPFIPNEI
jgi:hypothetical protein